jgi:large subunit ribosomal protein L33
MAKKKEGARIKIKLVSVEGEHKGKSVYVTYKNRNNTKERIELMKYDRFAKKHVLHREAK